MSRALKSRLNVRELEPRALMSADPLPVLLVIADHQDFFYREYADTRNSLLADNIPVVVAATTTQPSTPHPGSGQGTGSGVVIPDIALADVDPTDYSAIAFVGGWGSSMYQYAFNDPDLDGDTDNFYQNPLYNGDPNLNDGLMAPQKIVVNNLIKSFVEADKPVAGVCHGVTVLAWARVDGVSPLAGRIAAVPIKDGSPAMFYNGQNFPGGYRMGQYDMVLANGGFPNDVSGEYGNPNTTTDDVVVDGPVITGADDWSAAYFGVVIAQEVRARLPVNEAPTAIDLSAAAVAENMSAGAVVGQLSATDPDEGDTFTYTLVEGAGSEDNGAFTIVGDELRTAAGFDYEARSDYSVRVRATDAGGLFTERAFAIAVTDVNEVPAGLALSGDAVAEGQAACTPVGSFTAADPEGDPLTYTLVAGPGSEGNAAFTIDGATLRTAAVLDVEQQATYSIRVRAADAGGLGVEATFTIHVTDVNTPPTLDASLTHLMAAVAKNAAEPPAVPVASLLAGTADAETPEDLGLAVVGTIGIAGTWEYALSAAGPWTALGPVSDTSAVLLAKDAFVRFRPAHNKTGYAGLMFKAWDGQAGSTGDTADTLNSPLQFSVLADAAWTPVGLPTGQFDELGRLVLPSMREDAAKPPSVPAKSVLGYLPAGFAAGTKLGLAVTGKTGMGTWEVKVGNAWQPVGMVSESSAHLLFPATAVRFVPAPDWSGEATLTYRAWDGGANYGVDTLTAVLNVTPVNDAPTLDTSIARVFDTEPRTVADLMAGSADIDGTVLGIAVTRTAYGPGILRSLDGGSTWSAIPSVSPGRPLVLPASALIRFDAAGETAARGSFEYRAWDGEAMSRATETATFSLGNAAPSFVPGPAPIIPAGAMSANGFAVSKLLGRMTDPDAGTKKGLGLIGATGNWECSLDGGRTWQSVGDLSAGRLLLRANDRLRTAGPVAEARLEFVAWDRTAGVAGDRLAGPSDSISAEALSAEFAA
jgi:putative intracellular protease/amidase